MARFAFHKYQGAGNDFVLFGPEVDGHLSREQIMHICDRHFGIGSDGVLFVSPSNSGDFFMRMFNPDGSEAEMCGNGIRCFAKHLKDYGLSSKEVIPIESKVTLHQCRLQMDRDGKVSEVEVSMGRPGFSRLEIGMEGEGDFIDQPIEREGTSFRGTAVSMGNPHLVIFEPKSITEAKIVGPMFESHPLFANRCNVEFVEQLGEQHLRVVVFERGAGITLACGTGACASVAAAVAEKRVDGTQPVKVDLPGGSLSIRYDEQSGELLMLGPATYVFGGTIEL